MFFVLRFSFFSNPSLYCRSYVDDSELPEGSTFQSIPEAALSIPMKSVR